MTRTERPRLPRGVYALGATSLLNDAAGEMIYPLLPVFLASLLGAGAVALGVIEGAADATASLLKLVSGRWSDRVGRRKPFVLAGYGIAAAVRPFIAFAGSAGAVLVVRVIDRFGKGLRGSPRDALLADITPPEMRGRAFGVHEAMDHAGAVVGPLVAWVLLAADVPLRVVFALSAVPALAAVAVVVAVVRESQPGMAAPSPSTPTPSRPELNASREPYLSRPFVGYVAASTLFALGNSSDAFLLLRAHDAGVSAAAIPLLWALHHVVKATVSPWGGGLADRLGRRRTVAAGWLVYAAVYMGFAVARGAAGIVALFVVYGLHFALVGGAQKALVADLVPAAARGRAFGFYQACLGFAALPASALFGVVYQKAGAASAFLVGAGFAALGLALLPLSRSKPA